MEYVKQNLNEWFTLLARSLIQFVLRWMLKNTEEKIKTSWHFIDYMALHDIDITWH